MKRFHIFQAGLSLIELMVAMTLGLMISVSLGYIMMGSQTTYRTQDASARVQDTGRFALDFIGRNLRMAGRTDITPLSADARVGLPAGTVPITGANGDGVPDSLTVRYQLSNLNGVDVEDGNGNGGATSPLALANLTAIPGLPSVCGSSGDKECKYGTVVNIISLVAGTATTEPQLQCLGNGSGTSEPFAEGVEDLQFLYGVDSTGDDTVDSWSDAPGDWTQIVAVQVCILVRSTSNGVVSAAQTYRNCAGNSVTATDTRLRRTFTSVFTLRNRVNLLPQ